MSALRSPLLTRREFAWAAGVSTAGLCLGCGTPEVSGRWLRFRVLGELAVFTKWLARQHAPGYIGEVGWPDDYRGESREWNHLADAGYTAADRAGLWATAWASGEWWPTTYPLACYYRTTRSGPVDTANTQASVIERHRTTAAVERGVNVAGGAFGAPSVTPEASFSNASPGHIEHDYHYDSAASFAYLRSRGVRLARLEFRWERLQPALGGPLDQDELARLREAVAGARASGIGVILDLHNYGGYYLEQGGMGLRRTLGTAELPIAALADAWARISTAFQGSAGVIAYGLMNEPANMAAIAGRSPALIWEEASQAALDAIRANGDQRLVMVGGYEYSAVQTWAANHPTAWIRDELNQFRYEAHHYWDSDHSSQYLASFAEEERRAASLLSA